MQLTRLSLLIFLLSTGILTAQQTNYQQDVSAIKQMCGCFEVDFAFSETFSPDSAYKFRDNYHASGLEWVELVEELPGKLVLQHLLIVDDSTVIKHWRQDWVFENTTLLAFDHDARWVPYTLGHKAVQGTWTQKVYQVDDSPRYEGFATWIHADGRHYWENTTDSPLPRREYTKRSDYNVMNRRNRHEITAQGWIHEQDNAKILRSDEAPDKLIAQEKGLNSYTLVPASRCQIAQEWWAANGAAWASVRTAWDKITLEDRPFSVMPKVDEMRFSQLFAKTPKTEVEALVRRFVQQEKR